MQAIRTIARRLGHFQNGPAYRAHAVVTNGTGPERAAYVIVAAFCHGGVIQCLLAIYEPCIPLSALVGARFPALAAFAGERDAGLLQISRGEPRFVFKTSAT